ncbi:Peroxisomal membrane protein PAS20 [Lecanora helva]
MAEVVGTVASVLTLASAFKHCVEAFDLIHTPRNQAQDLKRMALKLNIEKCRLYLWGQSMGLTSPQNPLNENLFDFSPYSTLIAETLEFILDLFRDSEKLKHRYGCAVAQVQDKTTVAPPLPRRKTLPYLNTSFDNFKLRPRIVSRTLSAKRTTCWIIRDRGKFETLILEARHLIDGLQDITKDVRGRKPRHGVVRSRLSRLVTGMKRLQFTKGISSPTTQCEVIDSGSSSIDDVRGSEWVSQICKVGNSP